MISKSEEEFESEEEFHEEENMEEENNQKSTTTRSEVQTTVTRTRHLSRIPARYHHLQAKEENIEEYTMESARVLSKMMCRANYTVIQIYSLKAGIKKHVESGRNAALDEMK